LDADVIINLHQMDLWDRFKDAYALYIPSIVADEVSHYLDADEIERAINLHSQVSAGLVIVDSLAGELTVVTSLLSGDLKEALGNGELQALALIQANQVPDARFCTCDGLAIEALAALGHSDRGISVEEALTKAGYTLPRRPWRPGCTRAHFQQHLTNGRVRRIQGLGIIDFNL